MARALALFVAAMAFQPAAAAASPFGVLVVAAEDAGAAGVPMERPARSAADVARRDLVKLQQTEVPLANPGFEEGGPTPAGWITTQHAGVPSYAFHLDETIANGGRRSLRIDNIGREPFGAIYQVFPAAAFTGKRLRFSADLRASNAGAGRRLGGAFLLVQAMRTGIPIAEERMKDRPLLGTRDWHRDSVELVIPPEADQVEVGLMLVGGGSVWFDEARLVVVAAP
jgi:hypothetical protein